MIVLIVGVYTVSRKILVTRLLLSGTVSTGAQKGENLCGTV